LTADRFASNIIELRRAEFEKLMQQVAQDPELRLSPFLLKFLTPGKN